jgi:hypothetical protein
MPLARTSPHEQQPFATAEEKRQTYRDALDVERAGYAKQLEAAETRKSWDGDAAGEALRLERLIEEIDAEKRRSLHEENAA